MKNLKTKIKKLFFPEKSMWIDISCFDESGEYILLQMRFNLKNNKKEFRRLSMGFVNDSRVKPTIFEKVIGVNNNTIEKTKKQ